MIIAAWKKNKCGSEGESEIACRIRSSASSWRPK